MSRNWKWFVPLLCLVALMFIGGLVASIMTLMKSSDAYTGAVVRAKTNPAVIAVLGTPIQEGFLFSGNISETGSGGSADLVIPIAGPKGTAKFLVSASRSLGKWHYDNLVVQVDKTQERIDILGTNQPPVAMPAQK